MRLALFLLLILASMAEAHNARICSNPRCAMCARLQAAHNAQHPHPHVAKVEMPRVYAPTPDDVISEVVRLADIQAGGIFVDLGSGDGRVVVAIAEAYGVKSVGIELDRDKIDQARALAIARGVDHLTKFIHADVKDVDLSKVDVVYVYLEYATLKALIPRFKTLKPGAKMISYQHRVPGLPVSEEPAEGESALFVWLIEE